MKSGNQQKDPRSGSFRLRLGIQIVVVAALAAVSSRAATSTNTVAETPPSSPREFFNAGTRKLQEGKLREAETMLETAVASQKERLQPVALYNLGHVRFVQGAEELKKGPQARPTAARGRTAARQGDEAVHLADEALASNRVREMVEAYVRGRGARRELRAAADAVKRAMDVFGAALSRWRRASGDFKSAAELNPADTNAVHNGKVTDRAIAKLVDSLMELQQAAAMLANQNRELGERMKQLRGRIPEPDMPPGAGGDEEDEDLPFGPKPGQQEGPSRDGEEIRLTPREAAQLLEGFKLDGDRRLPMGEGDRAQPRDRAGRNW